MQLRTKAVLKSKGSPTQYEQGVPDKVAAECIHCIYSFTDTNIAQVLDTASGEEEASDKVCEIVDVPPSLKSDVCTLVAVPVFSEAVLQDELSKKCHYISRKQHGFQSSKEFNDIF